MARSAALRDVGSSSAAWRTRPLNEPIVEACLVKLSFELRIHPVSLSLSAIHLRGLAGTLTPRLNEDGARSASARTPSGRPRGSVDRRLKLARLEGRAFDAGDRGLRARLHEKRGETGDVRRRHRCPVHAHPPPGLENVNPHARSDENSGTSASPRPLELWLDAKSATVWSLSIAPT